MLRAAIAVLCVSLMTLGTGSIQAKQLEIDVSAEAAILINADTGAILFEKNSHTPLHPASTTKMATILYALNQTGNNLDELVEAEREAIASITPAKKKKANYKTPPHWIEVGSNHIGIKKGEILPVRALLYGMMLASANDASNIIAQYIGGTIPGFMDQLNEYLKQIGCQETHFLNTHGLHHPDHLTTAYDLAKITREAMKNPFFMELFGTVTYLLPQTNKQPARTLAHTTHLLKKSSPYYYPKAIGAKRGYTTDALHSLVAAAKQDDRTLIAVVIRSSTFKDTCKDVTKMFETAFNEPKVTKRFLKAGAQTLTTKIKGASSELQTYLAEDISFSYFPSEEPRVRATLKWEPLTPPIAKNQKVGLITLTSSDGTIEKQAILLAQNEIRPSMMFSIKQRLQKWGASALMTKGSLVGGIVLFLLGLIFWISNKRRGSLSLMI